MCGDTEDIGEVENDGMQMVVVNGHVSVVGVAQKDIRVYDISGRLPDNRTLPTGVYVVKMDGLLARKMVAK